MTIEYNSACNEWKFKIGTKLFLVIGLLNVSTESINAFFVTCKFMLLVIADLE